MTLKSSLKNSAVLIKKSKKPFFAIFTLQLLFMVLFFAVHLHYQPKMLQNTKAILDYMENVQIGGQKAAQEMLAGKFSLGPDPLMISRNYREFRSSFVALSLISLLLFIAFCGTIWYFTSVISSNKKFNVKSYLNFILKFSVVSVIFAAFSFGAVFLALNSFFNPFSQASLPMLIFSIIATLILAYFTYVSFPLLGRHSLKELAKRIFSIGINHLFRIIFCIFIVLSLIASGLILVFYLIENGNILAMSASIAGVLLLMGFLRIFFCIYVNGLD